MFATPAPAMVNAVFDSPSDVPVTASAFTAGGDTVEFTLNFTPTPGTRLTVVNNTGIDFIDGTFANLPNGAMVNLSHNGNSYPFIAWYYGGNGNDLELIWPFTGIAAWGSNASNQLGGGISSNVNSPVETDRSGVLAGKTIVRLARGGGHSLALCSDGTLAAWGRNDFGQLGNNSATSSAVPVAVDRSGVLAGKTVVAIAASGSHSMALCSDGSVATWGYNTDSGQLGDNTTTNRSAPVLVNTSSGVSALFGKKVVAISAGGSHSLALCSDGILTAWGANNYGALGLGSAASSASRLAPVLVNAASGTSALNGRSVVAIASGNWHNLALCSDGTLAAWGPNLDGEVGDNSTTWRYAPVAVNRSSGSALFGKTITAIAAGYAHSLALCSDGTVTAWGDNAYGQLGDNSMVDRQVPVAVNRSAGISALAGKSVTAIAAGQIHSLARCSDGSSAAWGCNVFGQLGDGSFNQRNVPAAVSTESGTSAIAGRTLMGLSGSGAGAYHSLALFNAIQPAEIAISQPAGNSLLDGATVNFGTNAPGGPPVTLVFTVENLGEQPLTGLGILVNGIHASDFKVTSTPVAPVPPGGSTTFTVNFIPKKSGSRTAALHLYSNDSDESPFDIIFTGQALSFTSDADSDGMNDASEFLMSPLGFNWQTSQPALVANYYANAWGAGLSSLSQVQALNAGTPLIERAEDGEFTLTLELEKSTDLSNFQPFDFSGGVTDVQAAEGKIEIRFMSPENASFFRLKAR